MRAYLVEGFLYGKELPASFTLTDTESGTAFDSFRAEQVFAQNGETQYSVCVGGQPSLVKPGVYILTADGVSESVLSVSAVRVPVHTTDKGMPYPFDDDVYPVIFGGSQQLEAEIVISDIPEASLPKLLRTGNEEVFPDNVTRSYAYPKAMSDKERFVIRDGNIPESFEGKQPLCHGDKLIIRDGGEVVRTFLWDQISKIWYEKKNPDEYPLVPVKGGVYTMGDYRGKLYNYSFGVHNLNAKKHWINIYDPQFMGESAVGKDAVGVTGLKEDDTLAKDKTSDFWCFNDDAICLHDVEVSDFEIGKYHVTMDQYYAFINSLSGDTDEDLTYEINGTTYRVHQIAGVSISEKKRVPRDNGWGLGDRPSIGTSFNEIAEYCNWLSRKNGLEPCYSIKPIFNGAYGEGKTIANVTHYIGDSCMQKRFCFGEKLQLVEIVCDISKNGYRLPTEAEFEYVIRGGEKMSSVRGGKGYMYSGVETDSTEYNNHTSWQRKNTDNPQKNGVKEGDPVKDNMGGNGYSSPVGTRVPNAMGICDLSGNVWDMMNDVLGRSYFELCKAQGTVKDPMGPRFSVAQLSDMNNTPGDPFLADKYIYSYEKQPDGTMKRTGAKSIISAGKTHHVLRGGCFTNPLPFTSALHRHAAGGASYFENFVNSSNARMGFRLARTLKQ